MGNQTCCCQKKQNKNITWKWNEELVNRKRKQNWNEEELKGIRIEINEELKWTRTEINEELKWTRTEVNEELNKMKNWNEEEINDEK